MAYLEVIWRMFALTSAILGPVNPACRAIGLSRVRGWLPIKQGCHLIFSKETWIYNSWKTNCLEVLVECGSNPVDPPNFPSRWGAIMGFGTTNNYGFPLWVTEGSGFLWSRSILGDTDVFVFICWYILLSIFSLPPKMKLGWIFELTVEATSPNPTTGGGSSTWQHLPRG